MSKEAKVSVSYAHCSLFVVGVEMNCPMCKALVKSGERHTCSITQISQPTKPRRKR